MCPRTPLQGRRRAGAVRTPAFRPSCSRIPPGRAAQCRCGGPCRAFCTFGRDCTHRDVRFIDGSKGQTGVENCNKKQLKESPKGESLRLDFARCRYSLSWQTPARAGTAPGENNAWTRTSLPLRGGLLPPPSFLG